MKGKLKGVFFFIFFCLLNVINIPFFSLGNAFLLLDFGLGFMKGKLRGVFFIFFFFFFFFFFFVFGYFFLFIICFFCFFFFFCLWNVINISFASFFKKYLPELRFWLEL